MELIKTLRKIRACEGEAAAQLLLEAYVAQQLAEVREELVLTDKLLAERNRLLQAIPACPAHGSECVPHAIEWVQAAKEALAAAEQLLIRLGLHPAIQPAVAPQDHESHR
jgi:hypothetical protein